MQAQQAAAGLIIRFDLHLLARKGLDGIARTRVGIRQSTKPYCLVEHRTSRAARFTIPGRLIVRGAVRTTDRDVVPKEAAGILLGDGEA